MRLNPLRWSLRSKFLSIIFLVLLIPAAAVVLLKEVEKALVENLQQNLLLSSKLISLQLESNASWFRENQLPLSDHFVAAELFVFPLNQTVSLDGFFNEWRYIEKFKSSFNASGGSTDDNQMALLLGSRENRLYLSLQVIDNEIIYSRGNAGYRSDQLVVSFVDSQENPKRIFISPFSPGKIPVKKYASEEIIIDDYFTAHWAVTDNGFNLELGFPVGMKPKELRVTHFDVDRLKQDKHRNLVSTSKIELNPLVWPSGSLNRFIEQVELLPGQRLWVLDTQGRVLARNGNLQNINVNSDSNPLINWLLSTQAKPVPDQRFAQLRLNSTVIYDSLKGRASSTIESFRNSHSIALASTPISSNGKIIGAVFIEENVARIQLLQRKTLGQMLYVMTIIFVVILLLVVWYVSRITFRITRLKKQINQVVDDQGRMVTPVELQFVDGDEIDDLSNVFMQMSTKLHDYNDYLEKLASRLSHELRTPIAIVRSSLDNLLINMDDKESRETIERALDGTQRLGEIISRMRQASGVKDAMQAAQFEEIDFCHMLGQMVNGFNQSFSDYQFQFESNKASVITPISTDLMAELLDKLLANAMDFSQHNTPILIRLNQSEKQLCLSVTNQGALIPKKNQKKIFQSLVSIRENKRRSSPNLGLGLYVVRLIANFHGARVKAENLIDKSGVNFSVIWDK